MKSEPIKIIECQNWKDFDKKFNRNIPDPQNYLFRGQYSSDWIIETSFQRYYKKQNNINVLSGPHLQILLDQYEKLHKNYRDIINLKGVLNEPTTKDSDELMSYAQHHHLPTMLIDWTTTLDVSVFFSVSDEITNPLNHDFTSVFCLRNDKIRDKITNVTVRNAVFRGISPDEDFKLLESYGVKLLKPTNYQSLKTNERISEQNGVLIEFLAPYISFEDFIKSELDLFDSPILYHFKIPRIYAKEKLINLDTKSKISFKSIYPDIYGFAFYSCFNVFK